MTTDSHEAQHADHGHDDHGHDHHPGFIRTYLFSTDHKRIGVQFTLTSLFFLLIGGLLAMGVRWHLAYPKENLPLAGLMPEDMVETAPADPRVWMPGHEVVFYADFFHEGEVHQFKEGDEGTLKEFTKYDQARKKMKTPMEGVFTFKGEDYTISIDDFGGAPLRSKAEYSGFRDEVYSTLFTMHGSVMIFLVIIPLLVGGFGNFVVPLQIGARDMAFPVLNMITFWMIPPAAIIMMYGTFLDGTAGGPGAGWTSYPPISILDSVCQRVHAQNPIMDERQVVGAGNALKNVFVHVTKGPVLGKKHPPPAQPVVLDQKGCRYIPHVFGIMSGQPLEVRNSDGTTHNVHSLPKKNKEFNFAQAKGATKKVNDLKKAESFMIKCDVHDWMKTWCHVMEHPFYAVTDEKGMFEIKGVEAGDYELTFWHEKLGPQTAEVTLEAGKPAEVATVTLSDRRRR